MCASLKNSHFGRIFIKTLRLNRHFEKKFNPLRWIFSKNVKFFMWCFVFYAICRFLFGEFGGICHFERSALAQSEKSKEFKIRFDFVDTSLRSVWQQIRQYDEKFIGMIKFCQYDRVLASITNSSERLNFFKIYILHSVVHFPHNKKIHTSNLWILRCAQYDKI